MLDQRLSQPVGITTKAFLRAMLRVAIEAHQTHATSQQKQRFLYQLSAYFVHFLLCNSSNLMFSKGNARAEFCSGRKFLSTISLLNEWKLPFPDGRETSLLTKDLDWIHTHPRKTFRCVGNITVYDWLSLTLLSTPLTLILFNINFIYCQTPGSLSAKYAIEEI